MLRSKLAFFFYSHQNNSSSLLLRLVSRMIITSYEFIFFRYNSVENIFLHYYNRGSWGGESKSGLGSNLTSTSNLIVELPLLFREFSIKTVLDIPCGDFHWFQYVNLNGIKYTGADIVEDIIESNISKHKKNDISFIKFNLIKEIPPCFDLILCRDLFIHFSFQDALRSIKNLQLSNSIYLLTTTFRGESINKDIYTGDFYPINLEISPFFFPPPLKVIAEDDSSYNLHHSKKSLCLWKLDSLVSYG